MGIPIVQDSHPFINDATQVLADNGYRITTPRVAILTCLASATTALSPTEIVANLKRTKSGKGVDRVSVYRVLEVLLKNNLVHQIGPEGKYVRCAHVHCASLNHALLRCMKCGKTEEHHLAEKLLKPSYDYLKSKHGFSPTGHHVQIDGLCRHCS